MADYKQAVGPLLQLLMEGKTVLVIQMIGGLIQYQQVGLRQEGTHQGHTHGFAAAED